MTYTSIGISEELKQKLAMLKIVSKKRTMEELLTELYDFYKKNKGYEDINYNK
jgi:hypothetical protein